MQPAAHLLGRRFGVGTRPQRFCGGVGSNPAYTSQQVQSVRTPRYSVAGRKFLSDCGLPRRRIVYDTRSSGSVTFVTRARPHHHRYTLTRGQTDPDRASRDGGELPHHDTSANPNNGGCERNNLSPNQQHPRNRLAAMDLPLKDFSRRTGSRRRHRRPDWMVILRAILSCAVSNRSSWSRHRPGKPI